MDPALRDSYAACRRVHRRHDPTYYYATRRLPAEVRPAVHALYAFVREADELVDGPARAGDPAARRAALDRLESELLEGEPTAGPRVRRSPLWPTPERATTFRLRSWTPTWTRCGWTAAR